MEKNSMWYEDLGDEVPDSLESPNFPGTNEPEKMVWYSTLKTIIFYLLENSAWAFPPSALSQIRLNLLPKTL